MEVDLTSQKLIQLNLEKPEINTPQDYLNVHKFIFGDIYDWAGQIRTVDIFKGNTEYTMANKVSDELRTFFNNVKKENNFKGLDMETFKQRIAEPIVDLYFIHPFREGNTRTSTFVLESIANKAGYTLNLECIPKEIQMKTFERCGYTGNYDHLLELLDDYVDYVEFKGKLYELKPELKLEYDDYDEFDFI